MHQEAVVQEADLPLIEISTEETERKATHHPDQEAPLLEITDKRGEAHPAAAEVLAAGKAMVEVAAGKTLRMGIRLRTDEQLRYFTT